MLAKFHTFLVPGGSALLDVYSLNAFDQRKETAMYKANLLDGFWSPNKYFGFLNTFKYESEKVVLDKYTLIEADRTRTVYNWLQHFSPEELEREIVDCGFTVDGIYSDVAGSPFDSIPSHPDDHVRFLCPKSLPEKEDAGQVPYVPGAWRLRSP